MIIVTDLSDVLVKGINEVADRITADHGWEIGQQCQAHFHEVHDGFDELMRGWLTLDEFCEHFVSTHSLPFSKEYLKRVFLESFHERVAGTFEVYKSINYVPMQRDASAPPRIYLASDHIKELVPTIKEALPEIFEMFSGEFWSYEMGKLKRDSGFFEETLYKLKVCPKQIVLVDDNKANIDAASRVGIRGILFKDACKLKEELCNLGFGFSSN